jgi:hypothetical protein
MERGIGSAITMHGRFPFLCVPMAANGGSEGPAFIARKALGAPNGKIFIYNELAWILAIPEYDFLEGRMQHRNRLFVSLN